MNRKGIILAGGSGTRLHPLTKVVSKQLLPIYDKPLIYFPLTSLMLAGIRDILVITTPKDVDAFKALLGNGQQWGVDIHFAEQPSPDGLAQAFIIAEDYLNGSPSALVLGDNIFYGAKLSEKLISANHQKEGATIFTYRVQNPEQYGVAEISSTGDIIGISEKPKKPKSPFAVTGLYFFDKNAPERAKNIRPSHRGELEITDLIDTYITESKAKCVKLGRGYTWFDAGTYDGLLDANNFIATIEKRQGFKIACPEEIAFAANWISSQELAVMASRDRNLGPYLQSLLIK